MSAPPLLPSPLTGRLALLVDDLDPPFLDIRPVHGSRQIAIAGELDYATAGMLSAAVDAYLHTSPGTLTLDLAQVSFLDCSGLSALLAARRSQVDLVGCSAQVLRLFTLLGIERP